MFGLLFMTCSSDDVMRKKEKVAGEGRQMLLHYGRSLQDLYDEMRKRAKLDWPLLADEVTVTSLSKAKNHPMKKPNPNTNRLNDCCLASLFRFDHAAQGQPNAQVAALELFAQLLSHQEVVQALKSSADGGNSLVNALHDFFALVLKYNELHYANVIADARADKSNLVGAIVPQLAAHARAEGRTDFDEEAERSRMIAKIVGSHESLLNSGATAMHGVTAVLREKYGHDGEVRNGDVKEWTAC